MEGPGLAPEPKVIFTTGSPRLPRQSWAEVLAGKKNIAVKKQIKNKVNLPIGRSCYSNVPDLRYYKYKIRCQKHYYFKQTAIKG
jgi:hypothetical protein